MMGFKTIKMDILKTNKTESVARYLAFLLIAPLSCQSAIIFPNILWFNNQLCNFCDDFAKKKAASKRKGTVGSRGKITPNMAKPSIVRPSISQIYFMVRFI